VLVFEHQGMLQAQQGFRSGDDDEPLLAAQHPMPGSARSRPGRPESLPHQCRIEGPKLGQHAVSVCALLDGGDQPEDHEHDDTQNGHGGKPVHRRRACGR
jgi:hypothetical protein